MFCSIFYSKYFPSSQLMESKREFLNLFQGEMAMDEYETEFDRLSHFAPTLIVDDESRMKSFKKD